MVQDVQASCLWQGFDIVAYMVVSKDTISRRYEDGACAKREVGSKGKERIWVLPCRIFNG